MGFCCGFCPWFKEQSEGSEKLGEDNTQEPIHTGTLIQATVSTDHGVTLHILTTLRITKAKYFQLLASR